MIEQFFDLFIYLFRTIALSTFFKQFFLIGSIFGIIQYIYFRWFL